MADSWGIAKGYATPPNRPVKLSNRKDDYRGHWRVYIVKFWTCAPRVQILSIAWSFWENLAKSYVGSPWRVGAPTSGIRHWSGPHRFYVSCPPYPVAGSVVIRQFFQARELYTLSEKADVQFDIRQKSDNHQEGKVNNQFSLQHMLLDLSFIT